MVDEYGPFVHGLNKGGLEDIRGNQRLLSSPARGIAGGANAVRAYYGSFEKRQKNKNWHNPSKVYIEFMTFLPPYQHDPIMARWFMNEGEYLPIRITGIFYGSGKPWEIKPK
jgi:hypothetical protein